MTTNILKAEFIEEDYISAVETMISTSSYGRHKKFMEISRISQDRERELGYDGVLTSIVPFYLQFKRSSFYTPAFNGKLSSDRKQVFNQAFDKGFLGFSLHKDRNTGGYDQHNAIWELSKKSSAAYVAPLFYKSRNLTSLKRNEVNIPWSYIRQNVKDRAYRKDYLLQAIRTFRDSIVIVPHREVKDKGASHHYTYDKAMNCLAFHSEVEELEGLPRDLLEFLGELIDRTLETESREDISLSVLQTLPKLFGFTWSSRKFRTMLSHYLREVGLMANTLPRDAFAFLAKELDMSDRYFLLETLLKEELDIIQYTIRINA